MNKVFVGRLSRRTTEDGLLSLFSSVGEVIESEVVYDQETGKSRGFGFVTFETRGEAKKAIQNLNRVELDGNILRVEVAAII